MEPIKLGSEQREFKKFVPLAFGGHCYYTRQCTRYEVDENGHPKVNGLYLPDHHKDYTSQVEVLIIGPRVGQERSVEHRTKYDCRNPGELDPKKRMLGPKRVAKDVQVGDILLCPNEHSGILRSPLGANEYFIEENVPYYRFRPGEIDANDNGTTS
jgi:hypothetical protein